MVALQNNISTAPLHIGGATAQTGHAATLIQKCASTGFKGLNRVMLLRLDTEELEAVKDETTTAEIRLAMVAKALNLTQTKAAEVLEPLAFNSDLEEKKAMLESEAFEDILTDARKNERKGLLSDLQDETDGDVEELRTLLKTFLVKPKDAKKKSKLAVQVWPKPGEAPSADEFARLQPPGARVWNDPVLQSHQVFYKGSSCSRALRMHSPYCAATEVTQWAWSNHLATHSTDEAPKGLFDAGRWASQASFGTSCI